MIEPIEFLQFFDDSNLGVLDPISLLSVWSNIWIVEKIDNFLSYYSSRYQPTAWKFFFLRCFQFNVHGLKLGWGLSILIPLLLIKVILGQQIYDIALVRILCLRFGFCVKVKKIDEIGLWSFWSKIRLPKCIETIV